MKLNQRGWSLLEVLVAAGVMAFIAMSIVSILGAQYREGLALNEKIAAMDLEKILIQTLADGTVCAFQFSQNQGVSTNRFDGTRLTAANPGVIALSAILAAPSATAPALVKPQALMAVGEQLSPTTKSLQALSVSLANIRPGGTPDTWLAEFTVRFDAAKLVRAVHDLSVRTQVQTSGPANNKLITGCIGGGVAATNTYGGANPTSASPPDHTGLCVPGARLYKGTVVNCNHWIVDTTPVISGCATQYLGTLCKTQ